MFFALTSQAEFWDTSDELLFAGSWCARYDRRADWQHLRYRFLPDPWNDLSRYRRSVDYCRDSVERLLAPLTEYLNDSLSVRFSSRYWRILLGRWLAYHVQQMHYHYSVVEDAFKKFPDLRTLRLDPTSFQVPKNTEEFVQLSLKDAYHLQIFSHFLAARGHEHPMRALDSSSTPNVLVFPKKQLVSFFKRVLARVCASAVPPGFGEVLINELSLNRAERRRLFFGSKFKVLPYLAEIPQDMEFEPIWDDRRRGLAKIGDARDEFEKVLFSSLPHHLPTLYLEGYQAARDFSLSRLWRRPRVVFSAIGWDWSEAFKFAAAESAEEGSQVWGIQHGGTYGFAEHAEGEEFERSISDRFYSWGWASLEKDLKVKDLPHPQLTRVGMPRPGDNILFTPIVMHFHNMRQWRCQVMGEIGSDYIEREARLLRSLPKALQQKTATRIFPKDLGWRHQQRLRDLFPELQLDDSSKPFPHQLRKSRLAVFDCPMTTFLEAFAADVPCILTWNPNSWTFRREALPYFDALKTAGILFDEPEDAARQVAQIYDDPHAWWDSASVRGAREAFASRFALSRADWLDLWLKEMRTALRTHPDQSIP